MRLRWDRFQILALASAVGAFALVVAGGFVTQTVSGQGCPDWPLCGGQLLPDWGNNKMVTEWTHRTIAVIVGLLVLITAIFAWIDRRRQRRTLWAATMSLLLVIVQAAVGGAVVTYGLNQAVVIVHLSVAAAFFATAVATTLLAFVLPKPTPAAEAPATPPITTDSEP